MYVKCFEFQILRTKMFNWDVWILKVENWKLKFEISMWSVWNLKIWKLKCLNLDVWILKVENWKLKFEISL